MLKLKLQYFGHLMRRTDSLENSDAGKDWRWEEKGITEDEMVGWHHRLNGHEFEQAPGVGDGQGGLCSPWGRKELDMDWATELNWNIKLFLLYLIGMRLGSQETGWKREGSGWEEHIVAISFLWVTLDSSINHSSSKEVNVHVGLVAVGYKNFRVSGDLRVISSHDLLS